jgi:hypothetical protein
VIGTQGNLPIFAAAAKTTLLFYLKFLIRAIDKHRAFYRSEEKKAALVEKGAVASMSFRISRFTLSVSFRMPQLYD